MRNTKFFRFKLNDVTPEGKFTGHASVKTNVDLGRDKVMNGAFTKTLQENPEFPILWQHIESEPIGTASGKEDAKGLYVEGQLVMEVQRAREAHALMKAGAVKGLSFGYDVIKHSFEKGVRLLHELKLWEISPVTFPMNPLANIESVKANKFMSDFGAMNERAQMYRARSTMMDVLCSCIDESVYGPYDDSAPTDEELMAFVGGQIDEFKQAMMEWVPKYRAILQKEGDSAAKSFLESLFVKNDRAVQALLKGIEPSGNTHSENDGAAKAISTMDGLIAQMKSNLERK